MRRHPFQKNVYIDPELRDHLPEQTVNDLLQRLKQSSFRLSSDGDSSTSEFTFTISDRPEFFARFISRSNPPLPLFILTPRSLENLDRLPAEVLVFHTLHEAADWIAAHPDGAAYLERAIEKGGAGPAAGRSDRLPHRDGLRPRGERPGHERGAQDLQRQEASPSSIR